MQKIQPAKNDLNMDFLNSFDKPIGKPAATETKTQETAVIDSQTEITEIDATENIDTDFIENISIEDDNPLSKTIKSTQIVVRTTEKEREALKAYFMKHGVSVSKGLKIAVKYLEQQEKKGLVHFSDIGLF
ncbi:MAG: hypothetical protein MJ250_08930 [Alphaproteobacteria bacterium]|nr:hypothetical protein [Alphaproteobacteria bacterium]